MCMRVTGEFCLFVEASVIYLTSTVLHIGIILSTQPVMTMAEMLMKDWLHQYQQQVQRNCMPDGLLRPQCNPQLQPLFEAAQVQCAIRSVQTVAFNQVRLDRPSSRSKPLIYNLTILVRVFMRRLSALRGRVLGTEPGLVGVGGVVAPGNRGVELEGALVARAHADADAHSRQ